MLKLFVSLPLICVLGAATPNAPFVHEFSPGETIRYHYTLDVTAMTDRKHVRGEMALSIKSVDPEISGTESRNMVVPPQKLTRDFHLRPNGVLAFDGDKNAANNYITYDVRRYCSLPSTVAVGATWKCVTQTTGLFAGGEAHVRVVSISGSLATLEIDGSGTSAPHVEHDADTGKTFTSHQTVTWHEVVHFQDGLVQTSMRDQTTRTVVQNNVLQLRVIAKYDRA